LDYLRTLDWLRLLVLRPPPTGPPEDGIHAVGEDVVFAFAKFAIGIEEFEFSGGGFGGGLAVLLEVEAFLAQP